MHRPNFTVATNYAVQATTVVELSLSRFLKGSTVAYSTQLKDILHLGKIKNPRQKKESRQEIGVKLFI